MIGTACLHEADMLAVGAGDDCLDEAVRNINFRLDLCAVAVGGLRDHTKIIPVGVRLLAIEMPAIGPSLK
jgi:hypothetical protein